MRLNQNFRFPSIENLEKIMFPIGRNIHFVVLNIVIVQHSNDFQGANKDLQFCNIHPHPYKRTGENGRATIFWCFLREDIRKTGENSRKKLDGRQEIVVGGRARPKYRPSFYTGGGVMGFWQYFQEEIQHFLPIFDGPIRRKICDTYSSPISSNLMLDCVTAEDGQNYSRSAIEKWFQEGGKTSPMTGLQIGTRLSDNIVLAQQAQDFLTKCI